MSKTWARLESTYHLVRRERAGRLARIFALHEAGNGERAPAWYGLSADTVDRGLRELGHAGLLTRSFTEVENRLSPTGKTTQYKFALRPPFARPARKPAARGHLRAVGT